MQKLKVKILETISGLVDERILSAQHAINAAKESKNNETKSSAGDKFETGRAMMQLEQEKSEVQLSNAIILKTRLGQIDLSIQSENVSFGRLVETNQGYYFISIGIGKVKVEDQLVYAISLDSPIGILMNHKREGDKITFRGKEILIKKLY